MTFLLCSKINKKVPFSKYLNNIHKNLKFRKEEDHNNLLNFLDV